MNKIFKIYNKLYNTYGPQGWWPFMDLKEYYHKLDYSYPKNENQIFEVCLASILTQNRSFKQVVQSLENLRNADVLDYKKIKNLPIKKLKELIKPSGYSNQKSQYILNFINFFENLNGKIPTRDELLKIKGVGEETADSMLLYGFKQPHFKVDAYTKRLLLHNNLINEKTKYIEIKNLFEKELKKEIKDEHELVIVYQEFHALIVCHSKLYYSKQPYGNGCFINQIL
ncbi:endonuclease III domain-containing protein [Aliarcobacter cibarius]|uniref:Endonuclease III n=1 Tax=Aliarcobacter cibarius TaxID=255507 RepID=A0A5J6RGA6_9BACT|nr:endonuclease III [Aliarcobacter cibarius]QEZ88932.1 endonuclease III [Aliarcobacter cibarius]QKJ26976.1 endonuclease III [Aliarcobacter cibarius]TLS97748.1 endonuclease III domain-containing protein [Aliarcobacter cibarius]TLS98552.1 endonuclease III domain-containing protein [Aliarcobacter cibarius]TLT03054.1 endonuclease III domain-containing protein [Aliarcobacter cibarius]